MKHRPRTARGWYRLVVVKAVEACIGIGICYAGLWAFCSVVYKLLELIGAS